MQRISIWEQCKRKWNIREVEPERSEFQRDRERIVNSKAFRRMVDKAQIFTSSKGECDGKCCDYAEFVDEDIKAQLFTEYEFATTLEGQTVALADEIAQRGHDIDDAFSSGLLSFKEFQDYLKLSKLKPLNIIIEKTYKEVEEQEERILVDFQEMLTARVVSDIIGYLVNDVVNNSRKK